MLSARTGTRGYITVRESLIEKYLRERVEAVGGTAEKFVSPGRCNVPDRLVTFPKRAGTNLRMSKPCRIVFVETKATGKEPRPGQARDHKRRRDMGAEVWVIDTKEQVDEFINHYWPE